MTDPATPNADLLSPAVEGLKQRLAKQGLSGVEVAVGRGFTHHLGETGGMKQGNHTDNTADSYR